MELALIGTGTGVGKTRVTLLLAAALRARGRRVWLHKPVACGDWDGVSADDGRRLRAAVGDGQDPALICPREFPEPASPHVAAAAAGVQISAMKLTAALSRCRGGTHDLLVEGAGGLLAPLTSDRQTLAELLPQWELPALLVTRPDLGTLNHTALTVRVARAAGIRLLGLVLNTPEPVADSLAVRTAAAELVACTGIPLLARVAHGDDPAAGPALVNALLGGTFTP